MPTVVQFRRGTTSQNNAFTGSVGELSVDTQLDTIRVHDGSTAGGFELVQKAATQTLTNKTINLTSNTLTATLAQLNTAISDADVSTIDGTETLTNKTLASPVVTTQLTSSSASFALLDTPTTINLGAAATALTLGATTGTTTVRNSLVVTGDLTINGTTTTVNSTTIAVDDKNIVLGDIASPTDVTADGGGITLKGATDKSITWSATGWSSSEDFNLVTGKVYEINGTSVLSATTLGSGVTSSSLTTVGTIGTGVWQGTLIGATYGGTGVNNGSNTITVGGNFASSGAVTHAGAFSQTFTATATTSVTLPTAGTLATLAGSETLTNKTISGASNTLSNIANGSLTNSSISINGAAISLGGSITNLAVTTGKLSQFAATSSAELLGVISDETGTGPLVFGTSPTITTATLSGTTNITGHFLPTANITYDLGSSSNRFRDLYLAGTTIYLGTTKVMVDANGDMVSNKNFAASYPAGSNVAMGGGVSASGARLAALPLAIALGG